jgi:hypothetical protein
VRKKTKKLRKLEKKNNRKNRTVKKKPIKILKKPTVSVRFYKPKTEKTEPNPNRKKPSQTEKTEPNRFELVFVLKNLTETGRFEPVSVFLKKIRFNFFFL